MKFILILFLIYLAGICFFRFLLPLLLAFWAHRMASKMHRDTASFQRQSQRNARHEGDVTLNSTPDSTSTKAKVFKKEDGEYVDFEEVKS